MSLCQKFFKRLELIRSGAFVELSSAGVVDDKRLKNVIGESERKR